MGSSPPPFQLEDQTDEDFFDKLVDDDFVVTGTGSDRGVGEMARVLSNASLGNMGMSTEEGGEAIGAADQLESSSPGPSEVYAKDISLKAESTTLVSSDSITSDIEVPSSESPAWTASGIGSPDSTMGKSTGSKGTNIKVVQWSSFSADKEFPDLGGFGSYLDFAVEDSSKSSNKTSSVPASQASILENPGTDLNTYFGSLELEDRQVHEEEANEHATYSISSQQQDAQQAPDANDSQYWDNLYPGWKYDFSTGQWYQVDSYDSTVDGHLDSYETTVTNAEEGSRDKSYENQNPQLASDEAILDQKSEASYLQQTAQSVVQTVAESSTTSTVANWNQVSGGTTEYPPNMIFDPQYPGWYYDTVTQQWYSLESYTQSVQMFASPDQNQQTLNDNDDSYISFSEVNSSSHRNEASQFGNQTLLGQSSQELGPDWGGYSDSHPQQNVWQPEPANRSGSAAFFSGNHQTGNLYGSTGNARNYLETEGGFKTMETVPTQSYGKNNVATMFQGFTPAENMDQLSQPKMEQSQQTNIPHSYYGNQNSMNYSQQSFQSGNMSQSQFSHAHVEGRSSAGQPPHALVTFGFGGKLVIMKDSGASLSYGSQDAGGSTITILNLVDVVMENSNSSSIGIENHGYFHTLCKQSYPGPLVGGNAASKDLNKWIDERIASCESSSVDFRKGELLRLLLSLLKISCQHYGKLRSPFGSDPSVLESDGPESAVTKLFATARKNGSNLREYGAFTHCMHSLPNEGQIRTTAVEVQNLLVSGKRKEALQCAQEGLLWGPALVLAAQLGDKFYVETVKQMAHRQFICGSPLRTLCLLIAGQPADVFSADSSNSDLSNVMNASKQVLANGMLDDWEENLAIITANRTKDDELVIVHLGDCLWKERGEITAAHTCYLVAEANFESYSDSARLCLIGADHWKCPRTYASPEAIQRTEFYEYSKVLGNSQFVLLPFQPYKLIYAYMLAEVGKVSDSLRYCQAISKSLKNSTRAPEVEAWKLLASSLEERLRTHQQGGYGTNLAPAKLVGKLFTSIDRSISRMIGSPPPLSPVPPSNAQSNEYEGSSMPSKVANSQSTMAMSSLMPSASVETISEWTGDSRRSMHNRSVSEPDFGRTPKQAQMNPSGDASSADAQSKASNSGGPSRFGHFGSQLFQKTIGWVSRSRPGNQAKLGEKNKFYYDEKLKRWVEEGAEPPAEAAALPPPPPTSFQNGAPDYNISTAFKSQNPSADGGFETKPSTSIGHSPGIPPMPPSQNQFSARGRMGVRSRYVDTFNKGEAAASLFQSPLVPSVKPVDAAKFFVPTPVTSSELAGDATESIPKAPSTEDVSSAAMESSFAPPSSSHTMQRYPSMSNITSIQSKGMGVGTENGNGTHLTRTRAASWGGDFSDPFKTKMAEMKPFLDELGTPSTLTTYNTPLVPQTGNFPQVNGGNGADELHEVEL